MKSVHDSKPREDVINISYYLASIFKPVRKTGQMAQDLTPVMAGTALWGMPLDSLQVQCGVGQLRENKWS